MYRLWKAIESQQSQMEKLISNVLRIGWTTNLPRIRFEEYFDRLQKISDPMWIKMAHIQNDHDKSSVEELKDPFYRAG